MRILNAMSLFVASLGFLLSGQATAQDDDRGEWDSNPAALQATAQDDDPGQGGLIASSVPVVASKSDSLFGSALAAENLDSFRGGSELVANDMRLSGTTANNSASYVVTGANTINSGSFANLNGVPMVIQNSGANVLIQNAMIINLQLN